MGQKSYLGSYKSQSKAELKQRRRVQTKHADQSARNQVTDSEIAEIIKNMQQSGVKAPSTWMTMLMLTGFFTYQITHVMGQADSARSNHSDIRELSLEPTIDIDSKTTRSISDHQKNSLFPAKTIGMEFKILSPSLLDTSFHQSEDPYSKLRSSYREFSFVRLLECYQDPKCTYYDPEKFLKSASDAIKISLDIPSEPLSINLLKDYQQIDFDRKDSSSAQVGQYKNSEDMIYFVKTCQFNDPNACIKEVIGSTIVRRVLGESGSVAPSFLIFDEEQDLPMLAAPWDERYHSFEKVFQHNPIDPYDLRVDGLLVKSSMMPFVLGEFLFNKDLHRGNVGVIRPAGIVTNLDLGLAFDKQAMQNEIKYEAPFHERAELLQESSASRVLRIKFFFDKLFKDNLDLNDQTVIEALNRSIGEILSHPLEEFESIVVQECEQAKLFFGGVKSHFQSKLDKNLDINSDSLDIVRLDWKGTCRHILGTIRENYKGFSELANSLENALSERKGFTRK